jgi:CBS domain-containing protein
MLPLAQVPLLTGDETAIEALTALSSPTSNRGLVVENGHLNGLLSITDLTRALELRRSLRPSPGGSQPKLGGV